MKTSGDWTEVRCVEKAAMAAMMQSDESQTQLLALREWWHRHCKIFSEWWLVKATADEQLAILRGVCPDMPKVNSATRAAAASTGASPHEELKASDTLLPEIAEDALMAAGGKLVVLLITRRLASPDCSFASDLKFLNNLKNSGALPTLDQSGQLAQLQFPFVDPGDKDENIRVAKPSNKEEIDALLDDFANLRLVHADVWLAYRLRRDVITSFIIGLVEEVEKRIAVDSEVKQQPNPIVPSLRELTISEEKMAKMESEKTAAALREGESQSERG